LRPKNEGLRFELLYRGPEILGVGQIAWYPSGGVPNGAISPSTNREKDRENVAEVDDRKIETGSGAL
jgi:hypothetical protein